MMVRSYEVWRELEAAIADDARSNGGATELLRIVGGVSIGRAESDSVVGIKRSAKEHGMEAEILDRD